MLITTCPLKIKNNQKEQQPVSASLFPCCAYYGDIHDYMASQIPPHWHHELEILLLDCGRINTTLADLQVPIQAGQGYFINTNKLHSIYSTVETSCQYRSLVFDARILFGMAGTIFDIKYVRPFLEKGPPALLLKQEEAWQQEIYSAFEDAFTACAKEEFGYEFVVRHALSKILLVFQKSSGELSASRPTAMREERLKEMITWLDANYMQPVTLQALAGAVNFSPRECERSFQQVLQTTPMKYLLHRRVTAAMEQLANSDLPIIEVGASCGFYSHSYFSKQFRAITGYTPREYRANAHT